MTYETKHFFIEKIPQSTRVDVVCNDGYFIAQFCNVSEARKFIAHDALVAELEQCKNWFEQFSPTAQLITGQQAEHPMLTSIKSALAKARAGAA